MTPEQFCYWLQGFGELSKEPPTPEQWKSINEHLTTVFQKITPAGPGYVAPPPFMPAPSWPGGMPIVAC